MKIRIQVAQSLHCFKYNMDWMQRTNNRNYAINHRADLGQYFQVHNSYYCIKVVQPKPVSILNVLAKLIHLIHFTSIIHAYTPWKYKKIRDFQKIREFLMFSGGYTKRGLPFSTSIFYELSNTFPCQVWSVHKEKFVWH